MELGLEVTTNPFDLHFGEAYNALTLFKTDRPAGWLNDYLNEISSEANETLVQMHNKTCLFCVQCISILSIKVA